MFLLRELKGGCDKMLLTNDDKMNQEKLVKQS